MIGRPVPSLVPVEFSADVVAQLVSLTVLVPAGAKKMVVSWRLYDVGNNWYWAVDAPSVMI